MSIDFYSYDDTQDNAQIHHRSVVRSAYPYQFVDSDADLETAIAPLFNAPILAIDTETTGIDPHCHRLRLIQLAVPNQPVLVVDLFKLQQLSRLKSLLQSSVLKIGHHLKFDWQFLTQAGLQPQPPFFDTQLAFKVWTAGIPLRSSLQAVVKKLLSITLNKTLQQSDFSQDRLTSKQIQYAATDAGILLPVYDALVQRLIVAELSEIAQLESQCLPAFAQMELYGFGIDQERLRSQSIELTTQQTQVLTQIRQQLRLPGVQQTNLFSEHPNDINPNSSAQIKQALAADGLVVKSTSQRSLLPVADQHPAIPVLLLYRQLTKLIDCFYEPLPQTIHSTTQRIHPTWYQLGARSGRASCRNPALQTIPRQKRLRQCFVAAPGNVMIKSDYGQIELRIVAKISNDPELKRAFQAGEDLHCLTAAFLLDKLPTSITEEERRLAKAINFGLIYGMGAARLQSQALIKYGVSLSLADARRFRKRFFELYPGIKAWHEQMKQNVYVHSIKNCRTLTGRRRLWQDRPNLNEMINHPVQGLNADITKMALVQLSQRLPPDARLIGMLHDEILVECPEAIALNVSQLVERYMIKVAQHILNPIPVTVDVQIGQSWAG
jgi:DNA polymerase-1